VLVFPSWPEGRLTARSREALMDWVSMGGTLVFLGGANSAGYAAAEGDNLLPADVNSSSRYALNTQSGTLRLAPPGEDIGDTPSLLLSNMTLRPGAQVLVDAGDTDNPIPALVQQRLGKGRIIFAGADFQSDSLLSRALFAPMWQSVLPLPEPMDWRASLPDALKRTKTVTGRAARPPNLFLVVALCVIYTVIVGPVNFLFLGMTKRIQWAWFTVPAIVLFFTALIYTLGVWTKGGEPRELPRRAEAGEVGRRGCRPVGQSLHPGRPLLHQHIHRCGRRWTRLRTAPARHPTNQHRNHGGLMAAEDL
jgi:hypothetical protein